RGQRDEDPLVGRDLDEVAVVAAAPVARIARLERALLREQRALRRRRAGLGRGVRVAAPARGDDDRERDDDPRVHAPWYFATRRPRTQTVSGWPGPAGRALAST